MIRILLTNDDGIHSDGLIKLEDALKQLGDLKTQGVLTEQEFQQQKAKILGS